MAQAPAFISTGGITVKKGNSYTTADLPSFNPSVTIDTLRIVEAPRIWSKNLDRDGTHITVDGEPDYVKRGERGVRILIQRTGATFSTDKPNTPVFYRELEEIGLHPDNTYTFFGDCIVEFGTAK